MFYLKCTGRNEQVRAHHLNCFIAHSRVDSDAVTFLRNAIDTGIQQNVDAIVGQNLKNSGRDIRVLSRNQRRTALDDGHLAPETPIHLGELQADVAPPDDDQMIRQVVHVHHAGIRQIVDIVDSRNRRNGSPSTRIDENLLGFKELTAHGNRVRSLKTTVAFKGRDVLEPLHPALDTRRRSLDDGVFSSFDSSHIHFDRPIDRHTELATPPCDVGNTSTRHERLGRDASHIDARTAVKMAFNHSNTERLVIHPVGQSRPGLTGTDDDRVIRCGHVSVSS